MNKEGILFTVDEILLFGMSALAAYHDTSNPYTT